MRVRRISEEMQKDETLMGALRRAGAIPGAVIAAVSTPEGVLLGSSGETAEIVPEAAEHIFVTLTPESHAAVSHSLQPASTLTVARSSPRV